MQRKARELALFNLAIDSKPHGCDVVSLKVEDIAPHGYTMERATVRQKKTGRPVRFELTEQTRQTVDEYLRLAKRQPGSFLFGGRGGDKRSLTTRQYAWLVSTSAWHSKVESTVPYPGIGRYARDRRAGGQLTSARLASMQREHHR
jgi:integrase